MRQINFLPAFTLMLLMTLLSCAGIEQQDSAQGVDFPAQTPLKFAAWQPVQSSRHPVAANRAVKELLTQADALISNNALARASDKLERLLRIEPAYAQAWSRLAWIALQSNAPDRSRQMAQRSNSYAYDNTGLKALNWSFIRDASMLMNDEAAVRDAEAKIQQLGGGV